MKKVLLGATALTAAGAFAVTASPANAEFDLKMSGWQNNAIVYADVDTDGVNATSDTNGSGVSMYNSSEINFFATQKLDNGLTIISRIELESSAGGDQNADETQVHINGGFGSIELGGIDTANDNMHYGAPGVSMMGLSNSSYFGYLGLSASAAYLNTSWHMGADDALGVAYYTPRIAGFQAGASYSPNISQGNAEGAADADGNGNAVAVGLNYTTEMNGVGLKASAAGGQYTDQNAPNKSTVNFGGVVSYMGFEVGGDWARSVGANTYPDQPPAAAVNPVAGNAGTAAGNTNSVDASTWQLGASYGQGPWGVSYRYLQGEGRGDRDAVTMNKTSAHEVAGSYNLGPGVDLGAAFVISKHKGEAVGTADDNDGFLAVTSLAIAF